MRIELDAADLEPIVERVVAKTLRILSESKGDGFNSADRIAFTRKEASKAIGISLSKLDALTKAGKIPHLRLSGNGGAPSYPRDMLIDWLRVQAEKST